MPYYENELIDLGYECPHDCSPIADISGMDNCCASGGHQCQCFVHRGFAGYPDVAVSFQDERPGISTICIADAAPTGSSELTKEQFLEKLVAIYGWPAGTYVGDDNRPHGPDTLVIDNAIYENK